MNYFTEWRRSMDGPELALVTTRENGSIVEWIDLDVRELPDRPNCWGGSARLLANACWQRRKGCYSKSVEHCAGCR